MTGEDLPHRVQIERTPEQRAEEETIHRRFRPGITLGELVALGEVSEEDAAAMRAQQEAGPAPWPARELAVALRAERLRLGLSDADLAAISGIDRAAIHKIETGLNRNPTVATLDRLATAMGLQLAWSLEPSGASNR
ncbi:helix-turn-helix domain-containing protein [Tautonia marina]|uniref:helix-turn-helix domain-containing protein n=1 Tax=Tautonia marina TaxID=2653855 RepID=UPI001260C3B6|nr:helix-turn-helix transcriptional regulator [Tautonia marina]